MQIRLSFCPQFAVLLFPPSSSPVSLGGERIPTHPAAVNSTTVPSFGWFLSFSFDLLPPNVARERRGRGVICTVGMTFTRANCVQQLHDWTQFKVRGICLKHFFPRRIPYHPLSQPLGERGRRREERVHNCLLLVDERGEGEEERLIG